MSESQAALALDLAAIVRLSIHRAARLALRRREAELPAEAGRDGRHGRMSTARSYSRRPGPYPGETVSKDDRETGTLASEAGEVWRLVRAVALPLWSTDESGVGAGVRREVDSLAGA